MLVVIGIVVGVVISLIGSIIISLIPYVPFAPVFLTSVIPSVLIFVIQTYQIKTDITKFKSWLNGFISLFVISLLAFAIKNYFEAKAIANNPGSGLNWESIIIFNILYSLGAAMLISPISYFAIKWISRFKKQTI
ncbi:hypothetical protein [Aquibacillus salsiterrae]|uniref:Uncharacterized protein n=1 Tax=Aquibacillus salsiterrae TaxID=2950439 RepID=A0A9X4AEB5_9BACI|nr:hypothetical protein [Aquibacillus salsiterrae]MDC3416662.1 hypothetical protein [Aquibacillus salsiterrae]